MMKRWSAFILFALLIILSSCSQPMASRSNPSSPQKPSMSESDEGPFYVGSWEYVVAIPDDQNSYTSFNYILDFSADGLVKYTAGWPHSEVAAIYEGEYTANPNNTLTLELQCTYSDDGDDSVGDLKNTIEVSLHSTNLLGIKLVSGDKLFFHQIEGMPIWFTKSG